MGARHQGRRPCFGQVTATAWESHAILRYLAARHGGGRFWADDPVVRAAVDGWMDCRTPRCSPIFWSAVFWGFYRTPEDKRNWPAINAALARCAKQFGKLDMIF